MSVWTCSKTLYQVHQGSDNILEDAIMVSWSLLKISFVNFYSNATRWYSSYDLVWYRNDEWFHKKFLNDMSMKVKETYPKWNYGQSSKTSVPFKIVRFKILIRMNCVMSTQCDAYQFVSFLLWFVLNVEYSVSAHPSCSLIILVCLIAVVNSLQNYCNPRRSWKCKFIFITNRKTGI